MNICSICLVVFEYFNVTCFSAVPPVYEMLFNCVLYLLTCTFKIKHLPLFQAPKQYPYNNLYLERGGDPEKQPEEVKNYEI